jgi:hypothetical protein
VRQAAQELHANATFGGPPFPDAADQMQLVQSILSRPLKGLALEALDAAGQAKGIVAANKQHAAVVCFGSEADPPSRIVYVEPVPIKETAEQLMTILAIAAGGQGDVVIIAGARMASFQRRLIRELLRLSREPRFKGLRIRDTLYASNRPGRSGPGRDGKKPRRQSRRHRPGTASGDEALARLPGGPGLPGL